MFDRWRKEEKVTGSQEKKKDTLPIKNIPRWSPAPFFYQQIYKFF